MADNLRLWAERVAGALHDRDRRVGGYDPDELAAARRYDQASLAAARWSLEQSVASWVQVLTAAVAAELVVGHVTRGDQSAQDIALNNAHDAHHHLWDIERSLDA